MNALLEWVAFLGFLAVFSFAFGLYMISRKRPLWRIIDSSSEEKDKEESPNSHNLDQSSSEAA